MSDPVREVLRRAVPPARRLLPPVLFGVLSAGASVALIACSAWLITRAAEQPPVMYLGVAVVGVRAFALGRAVFRYLERLSGHDASFRQLASIRTGVFARIVPLAPDGLAATRRGELLARFTADVDELQYLPLRAVQPVVSALLVLAAAITGVALLAPAAAGALALVLAAGIVASLLAQRSAGARADRSLAPLRGELRAAITEHLESLDVLLAFDAEGPHRARVEELGRRLQRATVSRATAQGLAAAVMSALGGIAALTGLLVAVPLLGDGALTGPAFAVLCLVPLAIAEVATAIPAAGGAWRAARVSAARVAAAVPVEPPLGVPSDPAAPISPPVEGVPPRIELVGVGASWPTLDDGLGAERAEGRGLHEVDLVIEPGERVLVRGASGAGKTTLAHVLVRFLDYRGSYRLDGVEARETEAAGIRRLVGLVEQRPWLFDESVRQNLLFARDTADDAELEAVLTRVGLGDWVTTRGGLDAPVGERGALVSGGQAQRLALARAMLRGFPVLVLDEPTANVDRALADTLLAELLDAGDAPGRSIVLISHTELDESRFDRVVRLRDGRIDAAEPTAHAVPTATTLGAAARA